MEIKHPQYFGQLLHKKGFTTWFLYMFRVIEGRKFINEALHPYLFQAYQDVYDLKEKRLNINVCPRSAKTTLAKYFIAYTLAINPRSNFIYTSYSQALLTDISRDLTNILTHPIYLAMYDNGIKEEKQEFNAIDEFWQSYIKEETGKATFSSRKITTAEGGVVLFSSVGSQLTGFGCFDYNTLVLTENGYLKLGDIVENKIQIKVWAYNFKKQKRELKEIERFVKNEISPFLKIKLDNNEIINATPDHIFYLENGKEIEAKDLKIGFKLFSNAFNRLTNKVFFKRGNRKIVDIINSNHFEPSYCLTIKDYNNFFINNSQVLVHNCGVRGAKQFSGSLIIDDANKPSDIYSQVRRNKVKSYFEETLLSRLNDSEVAIVNIQQRLHLEDLSGFLLEKYKFNLLKLQLVVDGICQLPSQYTAERLEELQKNEYMFLSQYQQMPILASGAIFKRECFVFSNILPEKFDYTFITADLAYKDKQHNDFTCFSYWGVLNKQLYLIDVKRKKINSVEIDNWIRPWIMQKLGYGFRYIWIEDKAHGTFLLQQYRKDKLPVPSEQMIKQTLPRDGDKVMRANNILPCLSTINPNVILNNQIEGFNDLIEELLSFNNSAHDDFVDTFIDACKIGLFEEKKLYAF